MSAPAKGRSIVKEVQSQPRIDGVNALVYRSIGDYELRNFDPFLLFDEFNVDKNGGFPDHPHRGFETVTYMIEGEFQHEDFAGHAGTIGPGDLQWMTAGRGIVHAEMPVKAHTPAHGLQLWINLPKAEKMCEPRYQELLDKQVPRAIPEEGVEIKVIAGESHGVKAKVCTYTPMMYLDFKMAPNKSIVQTIPATFNGFIYGLKGTIYVGDAQVEGKPHKTLVLSEDGTESISISTKGEDAHFVIIGGQPLKEPIVQRGLFVMNTQAEIYQAMADFESGEHGFEHALEWHSKIGNM